MPQLSDGNFRFLNEADLDMIFTWRNSDRIRNSMFSDHIISWEEHQRWYQGLQKKDDVYLVFEFQNRPVGLVCFTDLNKLSDKCFWGFYLGDTRVPKGTGLLMGYWGLEFVFNDLKIRKLKSEVLASNTPSVAYHSKLGFYKEGCFRKEIFKNNRLEDVVLFAHFKDRWAEIRHEIEMAVNRY